MMNPSSYYWIIIAAGGERDANYRYHQDGEKQLRFLHVVAFF